MKNKEKKAYRGRCPQTPASALRLELRELFGSWEELGAGQNESLKYQKKEAGDKRNLSKKRT